ncbi:hypothetical protein KOW79_005111 [Hemibagrus wyckioides]|uniref:Glutaredoxin n=1 Tax=Hemibagrus wyckioides TaxID=337641 RepID=A0A9D3P254_9TELE|nr:hypothetical protein KOW79_005111 [Hemibagrus wyckioides]
MKTAQRAAGRESSVTDFRYNGDIIFKASASLTGVLMAVFVNHIAGRVTVYSVPGCPQCLQAKAALQALNLPLCEVDVSHDAAVRAWLNKTTGSSTVPQIFFNNVHIGGNDILQNLTAEELEPLVRMVKEKPVPPDALPLPAANSPECEEKDRGAISASELSEALRNLIMKLYSDHLSADGKSVDYKAMSKSTCYERYCELAVYLQRVELLSLSHEERLAFFINVYNALVIHGYLRLGFPKNIWQRYRFFNYVSYLIGGEVFTLQDIENGVLRGNRKGIAQLLKPFSKNDPRLQGVQSYLETVSVGAGFHSNKAEATPESLESQDQLNKQVSLPEAEPLIHFALNCGAKGCPPIRTYTSKDIGSQLRTAAEAFLEADDGCIVESMKREVKLSQIFKWYKADFGDTDEQLLNWVLNHMRASQKKTSLKTLLSTGNVKVSYMPYDWSTNSTH